MDIRLIAATNRDLEAAVADGRFRSDLYYRLNVVQLRIPPLRERPGDLELLVPRLVDAISRRLGLEARTVSEGAMARLREHGWPGNVRELRNVLERALIAAPGPEILEEHLPPLGEAPAPVAEPAGREGPDSGGALSLEAREKQAILEALERTGGHREKAARLLGISVRTLYNRLRQYGIRE